MDRMAVALLRVSLVLNLLISENSVPGQDFGLSYTSWAYRIETSIPISQRCLVNIINLVPCRAGNNSEQREESTAAAAAISSYRWDKADKVDKINPNYTNYFSRSRQRGIGNPHLLFRLAASKGLIFLREAAKRPFLEEFGETSFYHLRCAAVGRAPGATGTGPPAAGSAGSNSPASAGLW